MRYTKGKDGNNYVSVKVVIRVSDQEVRDIKEYLKAKGLPFNDSAVKEYVNSCTEYQPTGDLYESSYD